MIIGNTERVSQPAPLVVQLAEGAMHHEGRRAKIHVPD